MKPMKVGDFMYAILHIPSGQYLYMDRHKRGLDDNIYTIIYSEEEIAMYPNTPLKLALTKHKYLLYYLRALRSHRSLREFCCINNKYATFQDNFHEFAMVPADFAATMVRNV